MAVLAGPRVLLRSRHAAAPRLAVSAPHAAAWGPRQASARSVLPPRLHSVTAAALPPRAGPPPAGRRPAARRSGAQEPPAPGFYSGFGGSNALFAACWAGLTAYAFLWSPNQTPFRDTVFLEKLVGLGGDDGVVVNSVFFCLFNIMGVWPAVYAALLTPSGRSSNGVPPWPFITGSFAAGAFALLPYFALWSQPQEAPELASEEEMQSGSPFAKALESRLFAPLLGLATAGLVLKAATAGGVEWTEFSKLVQESRLVQVTTIDFCTLCLCAPFWVVNDAQARRWDSPLLPLLACLPLVGPVAYLNLRPRAGAEDAS